MPILNAQYTVNEGTRVKIASADNMPQTVLVHDAENAESTEIFLGNSTVDETSGLHIHSGATMTFTLRPDDELYAYSNQGNPMLHVLQIQKND